MVNKSDMVPKMKLLYTMTQYWPHKMLGAGWSRGVGWGQTQGQKQESSLPWWNLQSSFPSGVRGQKLLTK